MSVDQLLTVEYREVAGFPNYRVGNDGSIWSRAHGSWRILKGGIDKDGYRKVILCRSGERSYRRVAPLVLGAFVGPRPEGLEACHENGKCDDDCVGNLSWGTHKENIADKKRHGTDQIGERHGNAILTDEKVVAIRHGITSGRLLKEVAAEFGVSVATVHAVHSRRLWRHVP